MITVHSQSAIAPNLQAVYDVSTTGETTLTDGKPIIHDGNAMTPGNPFFILQNSGINVLEVSSDGAFFRGPLIANGPLASLRELRYSSDTAGSPDFQIRPRTSAFAQGPALLAFSSTISSATDSSLNQLQLFPTSQTFTASFDKIATMAGVVLTVDFTPAPGFGAFIGLGATIEFAQTTSLFGAANIVRHAQRYQPQSGAGAITIGPVFTFVHIATISANGIAGVVHSQTRDFSSQPVYNGDGGTLTIGLSQQFLATMSVNTGATVTTRHCFRADDGAGLGAIGVQRFFSATDCTRGTVENSVLWTDQPAGALNRMVRHLGTSQSDFGGPIALGAGASTPDWILSHLAANIATLADGDSLRISTGSLFMGATGDVALSRGAADRLDLATGDSLNIVSGDFTHAGTNVGFFGVAGATQAADPVALTDNSGGTANDTIALITNAANAGSADVGPTQDAIADLAAKVNALRDIVRRHGLAA